MRKKRRARKIILIIAGPNGAGKTTLAQDFLLREEGSPEFINADLIARGISPVAPESVAIEAGMLMLDKIRQKAGRGESFAFETTLSGLSYSRYIPVWRDNGYHVRLIFLTLPSADVAVDRVRIRVERGGHNVPEAVIRRRFELGKRNFERIYRGIVDSWALYDSSDLVPILKDSKP